MANQFGNNTSSLKPKQLMKIPLVLAVTILFISDSLCSGFNHVYWKGMTKCRMQGIEKKLASIRRRDATLITSNRRIDIISPSHRVILHSSRTVDNDDSENVRRSGNNGGNNGNNKISSSAIKGEVEDYLKIRDDDFLFRTKHWVVLVDDEESIRLAVGDYLYDQGYQVTACADADSLLQVCSTPMEGSRELPPIPDAIVSDIRMPGKDGLELLGLLKADERLGRVPVILLTAKTLTQDRVLGYKAGADAYLTKPFAPEELVVIIDNLIQRKTQMTGPNGKLLDLKMDMSNIKEILKQNGERVIRKTDVYLTPAEQEVLALLCKGFSNGEIAKKRGGISVSGVNNMIQNLYLKTQTRTRTELVRWAIQHGFVSPR